MRPKRDRTIAIVALAMIMAVVGLLGYVDWWRGSEDDGKKEPEPAAVPDWPGVETPLLYQEPGQVEREPFNVLFLVKGKTRNGQGKTYAWEAITVAHFDEALQKIALLSVPRNTYVEIAGKGKQTLDEAYGLGDTAFMRQVVKEITGMDMNFVMVLNEEQLARLVDLAGGIEFTVQDQVSDSRWGDLEPGTVRLGGTGVLLATVAPGYPGGEPARIRSQQALAIASANQVHRAGQQPGQAWTVNLGMEGVESDLSVEKGIRLLREFISWPVADISAGVAPGSSGTINGKSVYLLDQEKMEETAGSIEAGAKVP